MNEIEEVKSRLDIVEIIGQSVPLKKVGRTFKAPCPFHQEKTPSFIVTPDRQTWHCFGACATGGDVISFVMKREGMDFPEALRMLADRAGVKLPERKVSVEQDRERDRLFAANEAAAQYFAALLKTPSGSAASSYVDSRGIDDVTARDFGLGYSLDNWDDCRDHLREKGFADRELLAAGLVIQGDNGLYDRFRARLTFAIWNSKGRVIGFGARALDDSMPKYLNTAQTAIFDKGGTLYALDKALEAIRSAGQAVVVEGYMDVIAAHQFGHKNVVAQMGTALTDRQYALLKRVADKVVLVLDADGAGQDAMHKVALDVSGSERVSADAGAFKERLPVELQTSGHFYVAALPGGKDPDELIRKDPEVWRGTIDSARPYIDFWIEYVATRADLVSPQGKKAAAGEMLQIVRSIDDAVIRAHYIQKVSRLAQVSEPELASMARGAGRSGPRTNPGPGSGEPLSSEEFLLATLLQYNHLPVPLDASQDLLIDARGKAILELRRRHEDREVLKSNASPDLATYIERLIMSRLPISGEEQAAGVVDDCVRKLKQRRLQAEQQAIAAQIAALQDENRSSPDADAVDPTAFREMEVLIQRNMEIGRELHTRGRKDGPIPSGVE